MSQRSPIAERLWTKIAVGTWDECWPWMAGKNSTGYGIILVDRKCMLAHRLAYSTFNNVEVPPPHVMLCHSCDNPICCNPRHLWLGSAADNNADRHIKGRSRCGSMKGEENPMARLTADEARAIANAPGSLNKVAKQFGLRFQTVSDIRRGKLWSHVTGIQYVKRADDWIGPRQEEVLRYMQRILRDGPATIDNCAMAAAIKERWPGEARQIRHRLKSKGLVVKVRRGLWALPEQKAEAA